MEYLTAGEMAEKWNISARRVTLLCNQGRIEGAVKRGLMWFIPQDAQKPIDPRKLRKMNVN